ncbi:MAG TPA: HDIG domain-containing protein, partial [Chloroflexota bacterium]|nr:HDIG domain-containing protein [Chloroflexota bacterium]
MIAAPPAPATLLARVRELADVFAIERHELYLVGGCVRDQILGRPIHDLDLTTDATPDAIKRLATQVRPDAIYDVGARFGTIGLVFRLRRDPDGNEVETWTVEITTYRTEQYLDGTRKPTVAFGTSLVEDLARRDFTMNAIALDPRDGTFHDPFDGRADIEAKLIRAVGIPRERFTDDPLRMLRAVRFASQLGFTIERRTVEAIQESAHTLERISRERIAQELTATLVSPRPDTGLRLATDLGLMAHAIPEVLPMRGVSQRPMHHKDVFEHTMGVVRNIPPHPLLRWTALLHDIAKPQTKSVQGGEVHFFGHEEQGARMARRILRELHFDSHFIEKAAKLISMHLRVNSYDSEWTDSAVRRLIREAGDELPELIHLSRADVTSYRPEKQRAAAMRADEFEQRARELLEQEDVAKLQSPLDGNDLMALFGRGPGPWIRPIKDYL